MVGLLRLRKCSNEGTFRPELVRRPAERRNQTSVEQQKMVNELDGTVIEDVEDEESEDGGSVSIIRELHVYGTAVPVHGRDPTKFQHQVSSDPNSISLICVHSVVPLLYVSIGSFHGSVYLSLFSLHSS